MVYGVRWPSGFCAGRRGGRGVLAGPVRGAPSGEKVEPWQGQAKPELSCSTVQPRWGQTRLRAEKPASLWITTAGISVCRVREPGW